MTVVVGLTDLMLLSPASAEQSQFLHSVRQAADALLRILDEAVDLSRLEVGGLELNETEFSLSEIVEQARATLQKSSAPIELAVEIDDALPVRLVGDPDRLRQIVVGLVRSAAKSRTDKVYRLRIAGEPAAAEKLTLHFALGDAEEAFDTISPDESQGQKLSLASFGEHGYRGPGLALPVLAGLAELMGGRLWMASNVRSPLILQLTAQFALVDDRRRNEFLATLEDQLGPQAVRHSLRLLLVEDTPANNRFFSSVLSRRGHEVVAVSNGKEALEAFQSQPYHAPFDLALIDVEMPVMNGWQTADRLRQLENFQRRPVPLVALTAHAPDRRMERAQGGPFDAAITKPCELERLYDVVESLAVGQEICTAPEAATPSRDERIDYRGTLRRLGGDESLFHDLVQFCLEDVPVVVAELRNAIECGDANGIERAAHSLKGLVANFGAKNAAQGAADLQRLGHEGNIGEAKSAFPRLEDEVRLFVGELAGYRRPSP